VISDVIAVSLVCKVLIDDDDDDRVVSGIDSGVVGTEKYFDDNNRFDIVDIVLECASEERNGDDK
jgi:hypothetical protein